MARPLDEELIAAYRATEYRVFASPPFVLRIGEHCAALDALLAGTGATGAAFLTAWNPYSEPAPLAVNVARQAELIDIVEARGWRHWPGEGRGADPDWPPESRTGSPTRAGLPPACDSMGKCLRTCRAGRAVRKPTGSANR